MDFQVASFWFGSPLSCVERVCIQSFLDHGYTFNLYVLDLTMDVPDGVILHDARSIYSDEEFQKHPSSRRRAAIYSDIFRIHLLQKTDHVWVDLDIYCVNPLDLSSDYLFGVVWRNKAVNNCVLRLPKNSLALKLILEFLSSEVPLPHWLGADRIKGLVSKYETEGQISLYDLPWTTTGPSVTRWALSITGEISRGQHWHTYWPARGFLDPERAIESYEQPWVRFHHFQGETRGDLRKHFSGVPPRGSYIDVICQRHKIDVDRYPVI